VMGDYDTRNAAYLLLMVLAAVCGLFVTSVLIGMVTTSVQIRLERLRRGNAEVLETGHTLILGYDEHLTTILSELAAANETGKGAAVVVLCERDRCELEASCALALPRGKRLRVICRSGDPTCFAALHNAGLERCARVVALGCDDSEVIKEILAADTMLNACGAPESVAICAVLREESNLSAAAIAGGPRLELLYFGRLIARIFAQTCRQTGLAQVYQELFSFEGDEIYMEEAPALTGLPFAEVLLRYRRASVLGLRHGGRVQLNPPGGMRLQEGDEIVLVSSNPGAAKPLSEPGAVDTARVRLHAPETKTPVKVLMLGYSALSEAIAREIATYASEGSVLTVASVRAPAGEAALGGLAVRRTAADIHRIEVLEALLAEAPDCVLVLAEDGGGDADARTLALLLQLSRYYRLHPRPVLIVSEMLLKKNQALAACARVNDFVVGSNLAALVLTQVAQNRLMHPLFNELLTDEGNEIYIRPVSLFVELGVPVNLYTLAAATALSGQLLLGLRLCRADGRYVVLVNPDKEEMRVFSPEDGAIVLTED